MGAAAPHSRAGRPPRSASRAGVAAPRASAESGALQVPRMGDPALAAPLEPPAGPPAGRPNRHVRPA